MRWAALIMTFLAAVSCQSETKRLRLATTTTTVDSGLLQAILPTFERDYNIALDLVAVGTGEALALGRAGDVDVVLVHARQLEQSFVQEGYGINRQDVMYNDFVLLGPAEDPAGVQGGPDALLALSQIQATESLFVSRGDQSGTHLRELFLWQEANLSPEGSWYLKIGQGMGATLTFASEQQAYVLTDRGTFIKRKASGLELELMIEGDHRLLNPYSVIAINPAAHKDVKAEMATNFIDWITSSETQTAIDGYRVNEEQLFFSGSPANR